MKNLRSRLGLVAEGNTTGSAVLRLDKLPEELGPVKSVALSAARRLSNAMHGGYAVDSYAALEEASVVLLRVPDSSSRKVVQELTLSPLNFSEMSFVLCESWLGLETLEPFRKLGAQTATLMTLPLVRRDWFVMEGEAKPVRVMRRLIERSGRKVTELAPGGTSLLFAAELLASAIPLASYRAAQSTLRASGISGNVLTAVLEQLMLKASQDISKGAKGRWGGPLRECTEETSRSHLAAVAAAQPAIADFIEAQMESIERLG